jgi:hypothetical protein
MSRPIVLNQSSYKDFCNCKRLFAWRRLQWLTPPQRRSALEIGTAVHAGLAAFHAGGIDLKKEFPEPPKTEEEIARYDELNEIVQLSAKEQALHVALQGLRKRAGPRLAFEDKDLQEAEDIVTRTFLGYVEHYSQTDEVWKPLNQEIECLVEVGPPGTNTWIRMRADNLSIAKGGLYVVDYKTAGRLDVRDLLKYELDIQPTTYVYGLSKFLTEQARAEDPSADPIYIRGTIIDVAVKTQTPQFARELFTRSAFDLAEFEAEWLEVAEDLRKRLDRVDAGEPWKIVFHKNTDNCFRYGACAFRDLCLNDTPHRRKLYDRREPDYVDEAQAQLDAKEKQ